MIMSLKVDLPMTHANVLLGYPAAFAKEEPPGKHSASSKGSAVRYSCFQKLGAEFQLPLCGPHMMDSEVLWGPGFEVTDGCTCRLGLGFSDFWGAGNGQTPTLKNAAVLHAEFSKSRLWMQVKQVHSQGHVKNPRPCWKLELWRLKDAEQFATR